MYQKQNKVASNNTIKDLEVIIKKSKKHKFIKILTLKEKNKNLPVSMSIGILEKNKINLLANATDIKFRNLGCNAFLIFKTIMMSKTLGKNMFDFNGANSPQRADDKHSFGSYPELFFDIEI